MLVRLKVSCLCILEQPRQVIGNGVQPTNTYIQIFDALQSMLHSFFRLFICMYICIYVYIRMNVCAYSYS